MDARPSDGIALALKYGAPIYLSEAVMAQGGFTIKQGGAGGQLFVEPLNPPQEATGPEEPVETAIDDLLKDTAKGKPEASLAGVEDPGERLRILKGRLEEAVRLERYEEAQRIQKEIVRITGGQLEG